MDRAGVLCVTASREVAVFQACASSYVDAGSRRVDAHANKLAVSKMEGAKNAADALRQTVERGQQLALTIEGYREDPESE